MFIVPKPARKKSWYLRRGVHYTLALFLVFIYFSEQYVGKDIHSILGLIAGVLIIAMYILFIKLINKRHMALHNKIMYHTNLIVLLLVVLTGYIRLSISRTKVIIPTPDFFRQFPDYRQLIREAHEISVNIFIFLISFHVLGAIWKWTTNPRKDLIEYWKNKR